MGHSHPRYCVQPSSDGLAQSVILGRSFVDGHPSALVLGYNVFNDHDFQRLLDDANARAADATVFAYHVTDPARYGVDAFDANKQGLGFGEKPKSPKSNHAVT